MGVQAINAVALEDYVRGVVSRESPPPGTPAALQAQAVAARTYAVTTNKPGIGFDHYPDTRSQVYGGVAAETRNTDSAVRKTRLQVVTYDGKPVVTYFFSTSGGRTEDVENTSLGNEPLPWLKSVEDPYDKVSPKHRWGPIRMSFSSAGQRKLGGLVKGVVPRHQGDHARRSPRIVRAEVVGSRGRTRVDGATLRARLGLNDTWAFFTSISSGSEPTSKDVNGSEPADEPKPTPTPTPEPAPTDGTGGTSPSARAARALNRSLTGRVVPARPGDHVRVDRAVRGRWKRAGVVEVDAAAATASSSPPPAATASSTAATRDRASASSPADCHLTGRIDP